MEARTTDRSRAGTTAPGRTPARKVLRVLLVEDDPEMRRLVAAVLAREGCEVTQARDGIGLLRRIEAELWSDSPQEFDVIVSDIQMPDLTAIEVLEALRYRDVSTPVVLMTAYGSEEWAPRGARARGGGDAGQAVRVAGAAVGDPRGGAAA